MYKTAKGTLIDLNTTKIYILKVKPHKHDIYVKIVFSIDKSDYCYRDFVRHTLNYTTPDTCVFKLDDYVQYLSDNCEYDLIEDKETILFKKPTKENSIPVYLKPSPHKNLLQQRVHDLMCYNHPILKLNANGLFTYHEFVDNTNTTKGIVEDLKLLQQGKKINTTTSNECWLLRSIKALDLHWN